MAAQEHQDKATQGDHMHRNIVAVGGALVLLVEMLLKMLLEMVEMEQHLQ